MSDDPVIDFFVMEAVAHKVAQEDAEAEKAQERERWKRDTSSLDKHR